MYIQYVGFNVADGSRSYNFVVIDTEEVRNFTVNVQIGAFRPAALKLQDGPGICFVRLKNELQAESKESRAVAHLSIEELDIREYLVQHASPSPLAKKNPRHSDS